MMSRHIKCALAMLVILLWILSAIMLALATVIRNNISEIALVAEYTNVGDFYLGIFFPIIFPMLITVSCFIFVIGCLGCSGTFTESKALLGWFALSMLVTLCVELSTKVWRMIEYDLHYNDTDLDQLKLNIDQYAKRQDATWFENAWKEVHYKFNCCGVISYHDWTKANPKLLLSCCPENVDVKCNLNLLTNLTGCGTHLLHYLSTSKYITAVPYITALIGFTQVVSMILALKLWLIFCFNPKKSSFENVKPHKTYVVGAEHFNDKEPPCAANSYYLTPLKSCSDLKCLNEARLTTAHHYCNYNIDSSTRQCNNHCHQYCLEQHKIASGSGFDKQKNDEYIDQDKDSLNSQAIPSSLDHEKPGQSQYERLLSSCNSFFEEKTKCNTEQDQTSFIKKFKKTKKKDDAAPSQFPRPITGAKTLSENKISIAISDKQCLTQKDETQTGLN